MAPRSVDLHPSAIAEAEAASDWYVANAGERTAAKFERELEPLRWPEHRRGTRRYLLRRFPFAVIYRVSESSIQVVAVAHARRRPDYWMRR